MSKPQRLMGLFFVWNGWFQFQFVKDQTIRVLTLWEQENDDVDKAWPVVPEV